MQNFLRDAAEFLPILLQGVWLTILVTVGSLILSTILGLLWALMRVSGVRALSGLSASLINLIRGIPIIVLLFYLYFVMPDFGIAMTALQAAILGLGIAYSAYQAENFRAGIEAIDKGQIEAAQAIGMGWWLTMRRVVLPQAVRIEDDRRDRLSPDGYRCSARSLIQDVLQMVSCISEAVIVKSGHEGPPVVV